jgi:hypothetical protein
MIAWLLPAALAGLALLAVPILIHLLIRHRAKPLPFPSLRFVRASRTSAIRVHLPSDLALLLLRLAIIALAVAALARPVVLIPWRLAAWNGRTARAVVIDVSASMTPWRQEAEAVVEPEMRGAVFAQRIDAAELGSGLLLAVARLGTAPPARREIVVVSDFQQGALTRAATDRVPAAIGLRLVQVGAAVPERSVRGMELFGVQRTTAQEIVLSGASTGVRAAGGSAGGGLRILAAAADHAAVEALQRAVAAAGAPAPSPQQPITITFAGAPWTTRVSAISSAWMLQTVLRLGNDRETAEASAPVGAVEERAVQARSDDPGTDGKPWHVLFRDRHSRPLVRAAADGQQLIVDVAAPPSAFVSAAVLRGLLIARQGSSARPEDEIQRMSAAELTALSRQSGPIAVDGLWRSQEGADSRWCWGLVLALLAVEAVARRQRTAAGEESRADAA